MPWEEQGHRDCWSSTLYAACRTNGPISNSCLELVRQLFWATASVLMSDVRVCTYSTASSVRVAATSYNLSAADSLKTHPPLPSPKDVITNRENMREKQVVLSLALLEGRNILRFSPPFSILGGFHRKALETMHTWRSP